MESAFINPSNWLEIVLSKKITEENYINLLSTVYDLSLELEESGLPVKLLVDCSQFTEMDNMAEEHAIKGTRDLHFNQIACFKLNPQHIPLLGKVLNELETPNFRSFETREEAEEWLGL